MRIAAHGIISDAGGSGAGAFMDLLRALLDSGHALTFHGIPRFTEPKSLEGRAGYRYAPLKVDAIERCWRWARGSRYRSAAVSTLAHFAYQRAAIETMESAGETYDFVLCLDAINLWPSRLPVLSWPQSPPHTEWAALRDRDVFGQMARSDGVAHTAAIHGFYAYRWLQARAALSFSDLFLCGSRWARDGWLEFGLQEERAVTIGYPIDVASFAGVPAPGVRGKQVTLLWLGRVVPRKRFDLFLEGFKRLRGRRPDARAMIVGNLGEAGQAMLEPYRADPNLLVRPSVPRARIAELFAEADVLVQTSQNENFGFSVAEALAAGRAVVVGPTNGTADYAGGAGFRFSRYDADAVAEALEQACEAVADRGGAVAEEGRSQALRHFTPSAVAGRVLELAEFATAHRVRRLW